MWFHTYEYPDKAGKRCTALETASSGCDLRVTDMFSFFKRKKKANLTDIADAIAFANRSGKYYYKMSEEEVVLKPDRAFSVMGITDPELEADIKAHPDDYLPLPVLTAADEMQLMMNFAKMQRDRDLQSELVGLLQKPGAMRSFQARIRNGGMQDNYDRYRREICRKVAENWAKEKGLKGV